jgi:hypothetical protein
VFPQRDTVLLRLEVPASGFDSGFGHSVSARPFHQLEHTRCICNGFADHHRRKDLFHRDPCRISPFLRITRHLVACDLAPTLGAVGVFDTHQDDPPSMRSPETRLKKMYERQADLDQLDGFNG